MESLPLPKTFKLIKEEGNESIFVLEPCYPGYGVTIGNSLRRVLLSSLPGAAVTAVKIKGVDHEFSAIPGVKEDVIDVILNIKKLYLKSNSADPVRLILKAKGSKEILAGMADKNDQVEIANPNMKIATLDGKNSEFEMELIVTQGRGFSTVEMRESEKLEIGMIAIDAFYTPVRNLHFSVENMRVGKMTNYDRLTMSITTNGTMSGRDALDQGAKILVDHFQTLRKENIEDQDHPKAEVEDATIVVAAPVSPEVKSEPVKEVGAENDLLSLGLSRRSYNALLKNGVNKISDLKGLGQEQLNSFSGLGAKSITEILEVITKLNNETS